MLYRTLHRFTVVPGINSVLKYSNFQYATVSKSHLMTLRKKTGLPFAFCREGLLKCNDDYDKALEWLKEESIARGIAKSGKLATRAMTQGLLGLVQTQHSAVIVELNCETDFVARNSAFQNLVATTGLSVAASTFSEVKVQLNEEQLKQCRDIDTGSLLAESLSSIVGNVGENMAFRRSFIFQTKDSFLAAYAHMSSAGATSNLRGVKFGKYAAAIMYRPASASSNSPDWLDNAQKISSQICQHIVGMNPLPTLEVKSAPAKNVDEEKQLLLQPFLLNDQITVGKLLKDNAMDLQDFIRVECGAEDDCPEAAGGAEKTKISG